MIHITGILTETVLGGAQVEALQDGDIRLRFNAISIRMPADDALKLASEIIREKNAAELAERLRVETEKAGGLETNNKPEGARMEG